jgi:hypothetical protein
MEVVTLRQVLKAAYRHGCLPFLPDLSAPYKASGKVSHRAWFWPEEYKRFYAATREKAKSVKGPHGKWLREQFHDYVLFMVNTGLRPDESARPEFRDVAIVKGCPLMESRRPRNVPSLAILAQPPAGWISPAPTAALDGQFV